MFLSNSGPDHLQVNFRSSCRHCNCKPYHNHTKNKKFPTMQNFMKTSGLSVFVSFVQKTRLFHHPFHIRKILFTGGSDTFSEENSDNQNVIYKMDSFTYNFNAISYMKRSRSYFGLSVIQVTDAVCN